MLQTVQSTCFVVIIVRTCENNQNNFIFCKDNISRSAWYICNLKLNQKSEDMNSGPKDVISH